MSVPVSKRYVNSPTVGRGRGRVRESLLPLDQRADRDFSRCRNDGGKGIKGEGKGEEGHVESEWANGVDALYSSAGGKRRPALPQGRTCPFQLVFFACDSEFRKRIREGEEWNPFVVHANGRSWGGSG